MGKVATPTKHPGGRPPKDPADKVVKCRISMTQAHHAATEGDRAGMIRKALDLYFSIVKAVHDAPFPDGDKVSGVFIPRQEVELYLNPPSCDKQSEK